VNAAEKPGPLASIEEIQNAFGREDYVCDRPLALTVKLGWSLRKPLLLEGEAGVGKTKVAKVLNYAKQVLRIRVAETSGGIDFRRSFRRSAPSGMDLFSLARTSRRLRKLRLLVLCDVSGSMDCYGEFLTGSLLALERAVSGSRAFVFSTRMTEITELLKKRSIPEALAEMRRRARRWSGGTDLGAALAFVNRRVSVEPSARRTVCVILSDGYDQVDPGPIAREMAALSRRTRRVVWVNPLAGTEGYEPLARGMRAALPHVDDFLAAADVASLSGLCRRLGRERSQGRRTSEVVA
jgi:uncharacterized protein with von Willebrand factor type A (vWA) domain